MTEKEKVLKGLECCCAMSGHECRKCPYSDECLDTNQPYGIAHLAADALELLREQEQRINELEKKLRLLEYGDQDILQSGIMPAT